MNARVVGVGLLIAVLLGFCGWVWFVRQPSEPDGAGDASAEAGTDSTSPATTEPVRTDLLATRSFDPGDCATWETSSGAARATVVDCATPHLFQVAGSIDLREVSSLGRDYPDDGAWDVLTERDCGPIIEAHLGAPLDPNGRWAPGIIFPTVDGWNHGDRTVWCGIRSNDAEGVAADDEFVPMTGRVDPSAQSLLLPTGQCRAFQPDGDTSPVDCGQPHQIEVAATITLPDAADYPGEEAVTTACVDAAGRYFSGSYVAGPYRFDDRSWAAGQRAVTCVIGVAGDLFGWGTRTGPMADAA